MTRSRPWWPIPLILVSLLACSGDSEDPGNGGPITPPTPQLVDAAGVQVLQVALYQGPKRVLMEGGLPQSSTIPIIAGRAALVRVFYAADQTYDGQPVTARLRLADRDPIEVVTGPLAPASLEEDLNTTINFDVPAELVVESLDWGVSLLQEGPQGQGNPAASYPAPDTTEPVLIDGPQNTLRIIWAPFRYDADGSGRLPDLSPEAIESYRQRILSIYPVSNVEITVREPHPWSQPIEPDGQGWQQVGITLFGFRNQDGAGDDVYYYGIFNPADSFMQFCSTGCLLGVTLLNDNPPDTGSVALRLALGVGFEGYAADTAAHELGHAHGLEHANCGPGLDPQSIDQSFPHPGGGIGVWGFDLASRTLQDPNVMTDIMGYCNQQFISDYHYLKLQNRTKNVNLADWHGGPATYDLYAVDGAGTASFQVRVERARPLMGSPVEVTATTADGATRLTGQYFRYDHLPGGWLFVPVISPSVGRIDAVVGGVPTVGLR